jgi:hypothetical protein
MGRLIAWNSEAVQAMTAELLGSLRARMWTPLSVEGEFFVCPPGGLDGEAFGDATLDEEACGEIRGLIASGRVKRMASFCLSGSVGSAMRAGGGRQVVYLTSGTREGNHETAVKVEGWEFRAVAVRKNGGMVMSVNGDLAARCSPPGGGGSGEAIEAFRFRSDLSCRRGGGALLGGVLPKGDRSEGVYLFLRFH